MEDQETLKEFEAARMWTKLNRKERIGIRRLHVMTSHATRHPMQRMRRYPNATANVVSAVKHCNSSAFEWLSEGHHPALVKAPNPYAPLEKMLDWASSKSRALMPQHDAPSSSKQSSLLGPLFPILDELSWNTAIHFCGSWRSQLKSFLPRASEAWS